MSWCMLLMLLAQPPQPDPNVALELGKLKGSWRVVSISTNGADVAKAYANVRFRFNNNLLVMTDKDGTPFKNKDGKPGERAFVLDLAASPRAIDLTVSDKFKSLGIYELSGDDLKLCTAEPGLPRPKEFQSKDGILLVVLKRESK